MLKKLLLSVLVVTMIAWPPVYAAKLVAADDQPASNTAAVATITNGKAYTIHGLMCHFGYDLAPTSGTLTIKSGSTTISKVPVTAAGAGYLPLDGFATMAAGDTLSATLSAGGVGVTGYVSISGEYK
jgi:uncharacterized Zn-binding protein involved in type VI secretion